MVAAASLAAEADQGYVGTEHVLLALSRDVEGIAGQTLQRLGIRDALDGALRAAIEANGRGGPAGHPEDEVVVAFDPSVRANHPLRVVPEPE